MSARPKQVKGVSYRTMGDTPMGSVQFRGELPLTTVPAASDLTLYPSFSSYPLSVCFPLLVFNEGEAEGGEERESLKDRERKPMCPLCPGPPAAELQSQLQPESKTAYLSIQVVQ